MEHDQSYKMLFSHKEMVRDLLVGFVKGEWVPVLMFSMYRVVFMHLISNARAMLTNVAYLATFVAYLATLGFVVTSALASILFKDYRRRVLGLLLLHPEEQYHVREIARLTETVAGTLHKELSALAEAGILLKQTIGNQVQYRANKDCTIFPELSSILRKTSGVVDILAEALAPIEDKIDLAFIFGSVAKGKETEGSDIDVLIVGDVTFTDVVGAFYQSQDALGREINPKIYSAGEWAGLLSNKEAFVGNIMESPKLYIIGTADELK